MINTAVYVGTLLAIMILDKPHLFVTEFLGPNPEFLNTLQAMNPYEVRYNYQLWRPITSLFLTAGFMQYGFSSAYLLVFGFMLQASKI